jgi:hypothetical protein
MICTPVEKRIATMRLTTVAYSGFFSGGGEVQQIQLTIEGRENGDLGTVAPSQWFHSICKSMKPIFWLGCYGCKFHGTGNSAQLWQNFGISRGGLKLPKYPSVPHCFCSRSASFICPSLHGFQHAEPYSRIWHLFTHSIIHMKLTNNVMWIMSHNVAHCSLG